MFHFTPLLWFSISHQDLYVFFVRLNGERCPDKQTHSTDSCTLEKSQVWALQFLACNCCFASECQIQAPEAPRAWQYKDFDSKIITTQLYPFRNSALQKDYKPLQNKLDIWSMQPKKHWEVNDIGKICILMFWLYTSIFWFLGTVWRMSQHNCLYLDCMWKDSVWLYEGNPWRVTTDQISRKPYGSTRAEPKHQRCVLKKLHLYLKTIHLPMFSICLRSPEDEGIGDIAPVFWNNSNTTRTCISCVKLLGLWKRSFKVIWRENFPFLASSQA